MHEDRFPLILSLKTCYLASMNSWSFIILFCFIVSMTAHAQSKTIEWSPSFYKKNQEYVSEVLQLDLTFDDISFVGISGYHLDDEHRDITYRLGYEGSWSPWKTFAPGHDMGEKSRTVYEGGFIRSAFSSLQFKSRDLLESPLTIRLYEGKRNIITRPLTQRSSVCGRPDVCERSCWCETCPIDDSPQFTEPSHIVVHHSAGSNDPDLNFAEVVNYIWDLHVNTNGWDDVGYNWLIDPDGVLYEGRPDGYQGAHFSCINENTIGICLLGDFTSVSPSAKAIATLIDLIGFEATEHNIDVLGESYHVTGDFNLTTVAGHRDSSGSGNSCSSTACPGDQFYPMLDSIRAAVADLACYEDNLSSLQELASSSWSISPNPVRDMVLASSTEFARANMEILDLAGRICGKIRSNQSEDLSHLHSGLYFLMHEGKIIGKFMKK